MSSELLSKKIISAFFSLTFRKILLDLISFVTLYVVLAAVLPVETIGIFAVASAILLFFSYFSDIGLAAALIQKKVIENIDVSTTFIIQEVLVVIISLLLWFLAPLLSSFYRFDVSAMWLIRALSVGFFLTSLKVVPSVLLERELKFNPIVWVDVIEALTFNGFLIFLSFAKYDLWAYSYALIARSIVGAVLINVIAPWNFKLVFSKKSAEQLINFGIPFQLNSMLALLKDRLTPLVTAQIIGATGMGYLTWAQGISMRPLEIMTIVLRITFPAFSRLQDKPEQLKMIIEKSLFLTGLFIYPLIFGLLAIAPVVVENLGKTKWLPALPLLYLFSISSFWAIPSTTYTNVLNSVGKVNTTLKLMVMWTTLTWVLSPLLAIYYGFIGVGIASAIISFTSLIPILIVNKMYNINLTEIIWKPLFSSALMAVVVYILSLKFSTNWYQLIFLILSGGIVYAVIIIAISKNEVVSIFRNFKHVSS